MNPSIIVDPESWAFWNNIEYAYCAIPDIEEVFDGVHSVYAIGNDCVGAKLTIDTASALSAPPDLRDFTQMAYLGKAIYRLRREETLAGMEMGT